jgi:ABC-type multidrug transport system fused ATPase/permease subunit
MTVSLIGIMMFHYRLLGIIFLGRIIIYGISQYFFYNRTLPYANASQEQDSIVTGVLSDTITNHNNITTFASLGFENRKFQQETQLRKNLTKRSRFQKNIIYAVNALLINAMEI